MGKLFRYRLAIISVSSLLLVVVASLSFLTHSPSQTIMQVPAFGFAVRNHTAIMAGLIVVSVGFGLVGSRILFKEVEEERKAGKGMLEMVLLFLGTDERRLLNFLVEKGGHTTQAEIARLPNIGKVKAHRMVQKMREKQLIEIESHGKVRKIKLRHTILDLLKEE